MAGVNSTVKSNNQQRQPQQRAKQEQHTRTEDLNLDTALDDFDQDNRNALRNSQIIVQEKESSEDQFYTSDGSFLAGVDRARGGNDSSNGRVVSGPWTGDASTLPGTALEGSQDAVLNLDSGSAQVIDLQNDPRYQQQMQALQQQQELAAASVTSKEREELAREIEELEQWLSLALARERYTKEELLHIYACIMAMARIRLEELLGDTVQRDDAMLSEEQGAEASASGPGFENDDDGSDEEKKRLLRKSKYLENFTSVPLMKKMMGRDSARFQRLWKILDTHLEDQVDKEEVREEMFKHSF